MGESSKFNEMALWIVMKWTLYIARLLGVFMFSLYNWLFGQKFEHISL